MLKREVCSSSHALLRLLRQYSENTLTIKTEMKKTTSIIWCKNRPGAKGTGDEVREQSNVVECQLGTC